MNLETKWTPKPLYKYNSGQYTRARRKHGLRNSQDNEMNGLSPWTPNGDRMRQSGSESLFRRN